MIRIKYDDKKSLTDNVKYFLNCLNVQREEMRVGKVEDIKNETEANMIEVQQQLTDADLTQIETEQALTDMDLRLLELEVANE